MKNIIQCIIAALSLAVCSVIASAQISTLVMQDGQSFEDPSKAYGWNWLYSGVWGASSNTNIGLDGPGTWHAAIILNLTAHIGDSITKIGYYHGDSATVTAKIYTGNYQNPLILVGQSNPYTFSTPGWKQNIMLQTPVVITAPALYWIVLSIQDPGANYYPLGSRAPLNNNAGKISLDGSTWTDLSTYNLNYSWLMGAYVYSACPPPKNLNAINVGPYSATLQWAVQQGGTPSSWEIQYGPSGFSPGNGLTATSSTTSATLTNLSHSTQYDFYVRAVCGASVSPWAGPGNFITQYVNDNADFLSYYFGFPGETDNISYPLIEVNIPGNPNLSNLVAHFTVSPGVREVKVNGVEQISGQTPNNFYSPVLYSIRAEDSITVKNWLVIVNGYNNITTIQNEPFILYPNPCSDYITLYVSTNGNAKLYDITGKEIDSFQLNNPETKISTKHLKNGLYYLKLSNSEQQEIIRKFIVQR